jgi:hypothetical protein
LTVADAQVAQAEGDVEAVFEDDGGGVDQVYYVSVDVLE